MVARCMRRLQSLGAAARIAVALIGVAVAAGFAAPTASTAPERCDLGARNTIKGFYRVTVVACPGTIPIGQPTDWTIRVTTRSGAPVRGALGVTGGMPEHGHGFLTPPIVSRGQRAGEYQARLVFAMGGRWVVEFRITANGRRDVVRYQVTV
jgi:hypothetical protein